MGRPFRGRLTRHEAENYSLGVRRVFWDGRYYVIAVLPGGLYFRLM